MDREGPGVGGRRWLVSGTRQDLDYICSRVFFFKKSEANMENHDLVKLSLLLRFETFDMVKVLSTETLTELVF